MNGSNQTISARPPTVGVCPLSVIWPFFRLRRPPLHLPNRPRSPVSTPTTATAASKPGLHGLQENPI